MPKILVGNKLDLVAYLPDSVEDQKANALASKHNMPYYKTSALDGTGIDDAINGIIKTVFEKEIKPKLGMPLEPENIVITRKTMEVTPKKERKKCCKW